MFDAHKRSGKPGGNDWPRLVVLSFNLISLRAYNANYDDDDDDIYIYMPNGAFLCLFLNYECFMHT